eukprot:5856811-Alexandrium_andersonii.AAC.1
MPDFQTPDVRVATRQIPSANHASRCSDRSFRQRLLHIASVALSLVLGGACGAHEWLPRPLRHGGV